jgi:hypothetical protein
MWPQKLACTVILLGVAVCGCLAAPASARVVLWWRSPVVPLGVVPPPLLVVPPPPPPVAFYTAPPAYVPGHPARTGLLQLKVLPLTVEIYLDGRFLGRAQDFQNGRLDLPVSRGKHLVEIRLGTNAHSHWIRIRPGSTMVIEDELKSL